jgi:PA14 domain
LTRTKLWRLSLAAILGFGWLFITPAYSDDPLSLAAQEIQELNKSVSDLNYKDEFISLIDIAEQKYDDAVAAKEARDDAYDAYDAAVAAEATALSEKNLAQSAIDAQTITVSSALAQKNTAKDDLDLAQVNLSTANTNLQTTQSVVQNAGGAGLHYDVYTGIRQYSFLWLTNQMVPDQYLCSGTLNGNVLQPGSATCGRYYDFVVKITGTITVPSHWTETKFAGYTDDGFRMYVDGQLAINNWREQGSTWSAYSPIYDVSEDKTLDVEIWWYNGGGPGYFHLGWAIPGGWTGAGCDYTGGWGVNFSCNLNTFSSGSSPTQAQIDAYNAAVTAQTAAQSDYNTKLATYNTKTNIYNTENSTLNTYNQTLQSKTTAYNTAVTNTANALTAKNNADDAYDQAIIDMNNAIDNAWAYYEEQKAREIATALAQAAAAAANQPTPIASPDPEPSPEPEVSPEPSPEPSPEQTKPVDPTPEPTPETTNEPKPEPTDDPQPTPEPSPEPSPQPTDINPDPTPEPEPTPTSPSQESQDDNIIINEQLKELIPEKGTGTAEDLSGVIANLTSKDNKLIVLSKEQIAAVSQTLVALTQEAKQEVAQDLGIKAAEVAVIAEAMKSNPELATAFVEFKDRQAAAENATMPYTLADATTEVQTEAFLADPIGALTSIDLSKVFSPSEWGKDMTDDQREKAQEVVIPVIIASNIVAAAMTRRI